MAAVDAEVLGAVVPVERHAGRRGGGLESHADEHQGLVGLVPRHLDRVVYGVDDANVCAVGFGGEERSRRGGHAHHVAEGGDGDAVPRQGDGVGDLVAGGDAHGASGALGDGDAHIVQHLLEAEADDGVLVRSAYVHQADVDVQPPDPPQDLLRGLLVPVLELHRSTSSISMHLTVHSMPLTTSI